MSTENLTTAEAIQAALLADGVPAKAEHPQPSSTRPEVPVVGP